MVKIQRRNIDGNFKYRRRFINDDIQKLGYCFAVDKYDIVNIGLHFFSQECSTLC